jgi:hypothetical protein
MVHRCASGAARSRGKTRSAGPFDVSSTKAASMLGPAAQEAAGQNIDSGNSDEDGGGT